MKKEITKEDVMKAIRKALDNKKKVTAFLRGEMSKEELEKHGIKLARPL